MVVGGVLVADDDDAKSLRIQRLCPIVRPPFELNFDLDMDVLPVEIVENNSELLALQGNGAAALFP